ncbi:MOSC domain-containing protein [Stappia stellulata]|uniref:MOSC domain-containing protein n=1 Tax=Stappia stellulata TaxID=71235 RepID=UPI001CD21AD2|nr:MOSC domain-containing protein [Stappia stellulata]MCA1244795.1 MOSC domain-containing protein [Stappia stellulata]
MDLKDLLSRHAREGRIEWIGLRPARLAPVDEVRAAELQEDGLAGDHHSSGGKRAVTLIQAEHLPLIAGFAGLVSLAPARLRRNIVVSGINLAALRHRTVVLGHARIEISGPCAPCSRMETELGFGGYNAMRGHAGWYARVVSAGRIAIGDAVASISQAVD